MASLAGFSALNAVVDWAVRDGQMNKLPILALFGTILLAGCVGQPQPPIRQGSLFGNLTNLTYPASVTIDGIVFNFVDNSTYYSPQNSCNNGESGWAYEGGYWNGNPIVTICKYYAGGSINLLVDKSTNNYIYVNNPPQIISYICNHELYHLYSNATGDIDHQYLYSSGHLLQLNSSTCFKLVNYLVSGNLAQ